MYVINIVTFFESSMLNYKFKLDFSYTKCLFIERKYLLTFKMSLLVGSLKIITIILHTHCNTIVLCAYIKNIHLRLYIPLTDMF